MGTLFRGSPSTVNIAGVEYDALDVVSWMDTVVLSGGTLWITDQNPYLTRNENNGEGWEIVYPAVWARRFSPLESIGLEHVYIFSLRPGMDWVGTPQNLGMMQGESNIYPLYATPTNKFSGVEINNGKMSYLGHWEGEGLFWRDFARAAVVVVAVATGVSYVVPDVVASGAVGSADVVVSVAPTVSAVPVAAITPAVVAPVSTAATEWTLAGALAGVKTATAGIAAVKGVVSAMQTAIASDNPVQTSRPAPDPSNDPKGSDSTMLIAAGIAALFLIG